MTRGYVTFKIKDIADISIQEVSEYRGWTSGLVFFTVWSVYNTTKCMTALQIFAFNIFERFSECMVQIPENSVQIRFS